MDLEQQLRAALVTITPGPHVRAGVIERLGANSARRRPNRWLLASAVLALAAAAAMLAMQLLERQTAAVAVESQLTPQDPSTDGSGLTEAPDIQAAIPEQPVASAGTAQKVDPAVKPFTVQVLPLQSNAEDALRTEAIEAVYAAFVNGLRAVPGLTLVGTASDSDALEPADFRLTLTGAVTQGAPPGGPDFTMRVAAQRFGSGGIEAGNLSTGASGESVPRCVSPASIDVFAVDAACADAIGVATRLLAMVRKMLFPPDPQMQRHLQAQLVDQAGESAVRLRALSDLASLGRASGAYRGDELPPGLRDPAVIRAAIQFATTAQDPAVRAQVWYLLRRSRDPGLVIPLTAVLRGDGDDDTRVQAVEALRAGFATDPLVRAALADAASGDRDPMVRALAQRALGDDASWTAYVEDSLKNEELSPVERVAAFFHAYGLPSPRGYAGLSPDGRILRKLDDASVRALAGILPRAVADSEQYARASLTLVSQLAQLDHPAIPAMIIDGLENGATWMDPNYAIQALRRHTAIPKVRATLQKIAMEHPTPRVREAAAETLRGDVPQPLAAATRGGASAAPPPPRLGVSTEHVKAGPNVPADLVGKLAIAHMGFGTVAERAGIKERDILLEIDGKAITSGPQLIEVLDALPRDVGVDVVVSRDGQIMRLSARF